MGCPQCGTPIQPTWDWCMSCGFDPEGLKPEGWQPAAPLASPPPPAFAAPPPGAAAPPPPSFAAPPPGFGPRPGPGAPPPGYGGPYAAPAYSGPPAAPSSGGTVVKVLLGCGLAFLLFVFVCIAAVTLLGKNASSKFSGVGKVIDAPVTTPVGPTTSIPWSTWTSTLSGSTIDMPCVAPVVAPVAGTDSLYAATVSATCDLGPRAFVYFEGTTKPGEVFVNKDAALEGGLKGMTDSMHATASNAQKTTFLGAAALDAELTSSTLPGTGHALTIVTDNRVVMILTMGKAGAPLDWEQFKGSLHLGA